MNYIKNRGFSAIEMLIVISILSILLLILFYSYANFRGRQLLKNENENIISMLNDARSRTLASRNDMQYGVHVESDKIELFEGAIYSSSDPNNETHTIDSMLEIVSISLNGGGNDVVFERLTGATDNYGSMVIRLKSDITNSRTITIGTTGIIKW